MKRKILSALLLTLIITLTSSLYGCGKMYLDFESMLKINSQFKGVRTLTLNTGKELINNAQLKSKFDEVINNYCPSPLQHNESAEEGNLKYIFTLNFDSRSDYLSKLSVIMNKKVQAILSKPNSDLAKGWHYIEDFKTEDLLSWIKNGISEKKFTDLSFEMNLKSNIVNLDGDIQSCKTDNTEINSVKGHPVTGIYIETTNNKKDNYDRKFTISVPQKTYDDMGSKLSDIMNKRTLPSAAYSEWTQQGNNWDYQIVYKGLSLSELQSATALFLDCNTVSLYYGDKNNSSTPLAEQLVFEENINTLSFIPKEKSKIEFSYKYSLPLRTTHGEGVLLRSGVWAKSGDWVDGIYSLKSNDNIFDIRIPDGIQYEIKGINITLESYDDGNYTRYLDFIYDALNGEDGRNYAYNFLNKKGVDVSHIKVEEGLVCRLTSKGSAKKISDEVNRLFGGGNAIEYSQKTDSMSVVTDVSFSDTINIAYMLTGKNKNIPLIYKLYTKGDERVSRFYGTATDGSSDNSSLSSSRADGYILELQGGEASVKYTATIPYPQGVFIYCLISGLMVTITAVLILFLIKKSKGISKRKETEHQTTHYAPNKDQAQLPESHSDDKSNF